MIDECNANWEQIIPAKLLSAYPFQTKIKLFHAEIYALEKFIVFSPKAENHMKIIWHYSLKKTFLSFLCPRNHNPRRKGMTNLHRFIENHLRSLQLYNDFGAR